MPPLGPGDVAGAFQGGLSPVVTVTDAGSGAPIAAWTTSGGSGGARIMEEGDRYGVVWDTRTSGVVAGGTYRIAVGLAGETVELGHVDVMVVDASEHEAAAGAPTVVLGAQLSIAFRIAPSAVYCLDAPDCATWCVAASTPGGSWRARAALPFDPSTGHMPTYIGVAALLGKLHTISTERLSFGGGTTWLKVATYDPGSDTWSLPAGNGAYGGEQSAYFALAGFGHDLFKIAGMGIGPTAKVAAYDLLTASWGGAPSLGVSRGSLAAAVSDGRIYAIGGDVAPSEMDVESWDPVLETTAFTWTPEPSLPERRWELAAAAAAGRIYALGGWGAGGPAASNFEYDPGTKQWSVRAPMPTRRAGLGAATLAGKVYAIGGRSFYDGDTFAHEVYDPATDTWAAAAPLLPLASPAVTYAATIGCHVYAIASGTLQEYTAAGP